MTLNAVFLLVGLALFPVGPAAAQSSSRDTIRIVDIRLTGGVTSFSQRSTLAAESSTAVGQGVRVEAGLETAGLPWGGGAELRVRMSRVPRLGSGQGRVSNTHALAEGLAGTRSLRVRFGYGIRSVRGAFGLRSWSFLRTGAEMTIPLGLERVSLVVGGSRYLGVSAKGDDTSGGRGRDAELRLTVNMRGTAVFQLRPHLFFGYRYEEFTPDVVPALGGNRPERTAALTFGVGLHDPRGR